MCPVSPDPAGPEWLVQVVAELFDGQDPAEAKDWVRRVHDELDRLAGQVPLRVVHDWHAGTVAPMLTEAATGHDGDAEAQQAAQVLHARVLAGERVSDAEWVAALEPVLREVYYHAYAYAEAHSVAYHNAYAYAIANEFGEEGAVEYANYYAELSTGANCRAYADANAIASARALAAAFTAADAAAYAQTYPFAYARACAYAVANRGEQDDQVRRRRAAYRRLADGLADSLSRATA